MSLRPWMPLYVNDFQMDTLDLSADEVGVYMVMLMLVWRREDAAIPDDMDRLQRSLKQCFAGFHGHTFNRIVPKVLGRYFTLGEDGKYRNKRLTNERQKADKLSAKQKQNADKRWAKANNIIDLVDASAMPSHSHSHSHLQSERKKEKNIRAVGKPTRPYDDDKDFQEFWKVYPKRGGANPKIPASKAFGKSRKAGVDPAEIIAAAGRYAAAESKNINTPHIAQAVTWLNQSRWVDYPPPTEVVCRKIFIKAETEQWKAWTAFLGKPPPTNRDYGWYFDSEWPPKSKLIAAE